MATFVQLFVNEAKNQRKNIAVQTSIILTIWQKYDIERPIVKRRSVDMAQFDLTVSDFKMRNSRCRQKVTCK